MVNRGEEITFISTLIRAQAAQALSTNHTRNTIWNRIMKGLYGTFHKISMEAVKRKIRHTNGLPYSIRVSFAPGVIILPI